MFSVRFRKTIEKGARARPGHPLDAKWGASRRGPASPTHRAQARRRRSCVRNETAPANPLSILPRHLPLAPTSQPKRTSLVRHTPRRIVSRCLRLTRQPTCRGRVIPSPIQRSPRHPPPPRAAPLPHLPPNTYSPAPCFAPLHPRLLTPAHPSAAPSAAERSRHCAAADADARAVEAAALYPRFRRANCLHCDAN